MRIDDLQDFIDAYCPQARHQRKESWYPEKTPEGRSRKFACADVIARDKTSLDLFWIKDKSLDNLPEPEVLAEKIIDNIEAGLPNFRAVAQPLGS
jgi:type I restriction enzyme M protein